MKKILTLLIVVCLQVALLLGCTMPYGEPINYTFLQSRENVVKIEICTNNQAAINWLEGQKVSSLQHLTALSAEEIDSLWDELSGFPAHKQGKHPLMGCGDLVFVVTYENGQQELIGYGTVGVLNPDGTFNGYRDYAAFDGELLSNVFAKYADKEVLKRVSTSFCANDDAGKEKDPSYVP